MYTRILFGNELKERVAKKQGFIEIARWAYEMYLIHIEEINDDEFDHVLLTLSGMESGPEFAFTYERLNEIADDLIAGRDVNLDY